MSHNLNKVFKAIADPTRREIFHVLVLASSALSITQISEHFEMSRQGVTKHIRLLEDAGMVEINSQGRERYCNAIPNSLEEIRNWAAYYDRFWDNKLDNLSKFLDDKKAR